MTELTLEELERWERFFKTRWPETQFGPPNEWPKLIAAARAYLNPWRPISEAPKDGTRVWLYCDDKEYGYAALTDVGHWGCKPHCFSSKHQCNRHPSKDCEFMWMGDMGETYARTFTHFAPLPKGPLCESGVEASPYCKQCGLGVDDCKCDNGGLFPNPLAKKALPLAPDNTCKTCGKIEWFCRCPKPPIESGMDKLQRLGEEYDAAPERPAGADIVERLRRYWDNYPDGIGLELSLTLVREAADEIERLRAEIKKEEHIAIINEDIER